MRIWHFAHDSPLAVNPYKQLYWLLSLLWWRCHEIFNRCMLQYVTCCSSGCCSSAFCTLTCRLTWLFTSSSHLGLTSKHAAPSPSSMLSFSFPLISLPPPDLFSTLNRLHPRSLNAINSNQISLCLLCPVHHKIFTTLRYCISYSNPTERIFHEKLLAGQTKVFNNYKYCIKSESQTAEEALHKSRDTHRQISSEKALLRILLEVAFKLSHWGAEHLSLKQSANWNQLCSPSPALRSRPQPCPFLTVQISSRQTQH